MILLLAACATPPCETATWDGWAEGFFTTWCRSCHSAASADRHGAPASVNFDSYEEVDAQRAAIEDAVLVRGSMPLGGGVYPEDLDRLEIFLACEQAP